MTVHHPPHRYPRRRREPPAHLSPVLPPKSEQQRTKFGLGHDFSAILVPAPDRSRPLRGYVARPAWRDEGPSVVGMPVVLNVGLAEPGVDLALCAMKLHAAMLAAGSDPTDAASLPENAAIHRSPLRVGPTSGSRSCAATNRSTFWRVETSFP